MWKFNIAYSYKRVFLFKIMFIPNEKRKKIYHFPSKRTQFPVRLNFAMSINKIQGHNNPILTHKDVKEKSSAFIIFE